jgi:hypothetical protein
MVGVAQLVEHLVVVQDVAGSSPVTHPRGVSVDIVGLPDDDARTPRGKPNAGSGNDRRGGSMTCYPSPLTRALPPRQLIGGCR